MYRLLMGLVIVSISAQAKLDWPSHADLTDSFQFFLNDNYQIGEEWGKKEVDLDNLDPKTPYGRAAMATANFGSATGFYLGTFDGAHVVGTNNHVCPSATACVGRSIRFPGVTGRTRHKVTTHLGNWKDYDAALVLIEIKKDEHKKALNSIGENFAFKRGIKKGMDLITIGFGRANNPRVKMMANQDRDCRVFSDEVRQMKDPDKFNPGKDEVWSFANGCDVSHGDSGSAMVNRDTGEVVGIIWTGGIPKDAKTIQSSAYLDRIYKDDDEDIWTELSYAVPATEIGKLLQKQIDGGKLPAKTKAIFKAMLGS